MGYAAGDEVLRKLAHRLRAELRPYDGVGRYGGDEFLLVLPGCDAETTLRRADEIRRSVCAIPATPSLRHYQHGGRELTTTNSVILTCC
jgi:diguanylate cyclase (GGDEF)-like protein